MKLWIHPAAADELDEAAAWYDAREPGLGDELVEEVEHLQRFPYQLPFSLGGDRVSVWAVAHFKRRGGYWRSRT